MTEFKTQSEGAVILTKPACVYAYEANLDDMNRKRLAEWRRRKKKYKCGWRPYKYEQDEMMANLQEHINTARLRLAILDLEDIQNGQ